MAPLELLTSADPALAAVGSDPLYAWGSNDSGQLGAGFFGSTASIVQVSLPAGVTAEGVSGGLSNAYAIGSDGRLYAWGNGGLGALGNGTTRINADIPVAVSLPSAVTAKAVAAGGVGGYAIGSDGNLYAWGDDIQGQLGNGFFPLEESDLPVVVSLPAGVTATAIAGGFVDGYAIGSDGKLYAWGNNQFGELGDGNTTSSDTPVAVSLPTGIAPTAIAASTETGYAIGSDGHLYAWGFNAQGQVGDGTSTGPDACVESLPCSTTPVQISLPTRATPIAVAGGGATGYAIGSDGHLYAWGDNSSGELGIGMSTGPETCNTTACSTTPVQVSFPAGVIPHAIAGGGATGYAIGSDGRLYAWGNNGSGQLGDGTSSGPDTCNSVPCSTVPVPVSLPSGSIAEGLGSTANSGYAISKAATTTQLASSPDPARIGQRVTYTASVRVVPPGTGSPTGTVSFSDGGVPISGCGEAALSTGQATCTVSYATTGSHVIVATYSGDANFSSSTSPELGETVASCRSVTTGCNLKGADLMNANLTGVNLTGVNLKGANLSGANLSGARLTGVNLSGANMSGTNLSGTDLSGVNLSGVVWANTICPDGTNSNADGGTCIGHL